MRAAGGAAKKLSHFVHLSLCDFSAFSAVNYERCSRTNYFQKFWKFLLMFRVNMRINA
jgi:hypothetical protein